MIESLLEIAVVLHHYSPKLAGNPQFSNSGNWALAPQNKLSARLPIRDTASFARVNSSDIFPYQILLLTELKTITNLLYPPWASNCVNSVVRPLSIRYFLFFV